MRRNTIVQIKKIWLNEDKLWAEFNDGRTVDVPVKWFPNLSKGNPQQLDHYEIWGDKQYINWPDLDEDISAETLVSLSVHGLPTGAMGLNDSNDFFNAEHAG